MSLTDLGPVAIGFGTLAGLVFVIRLALSYQRNVTEALITENERLRRLLASKEAVWSPPTPGPGPKPPTPPPES